MEGARLKHWIRPAKDRSVGSSSIDSGQKRAKQQGALLSQNSLLYPGYAKPCNALCLRCRMRQGIKLLAYLRGWLVKALPTEKLPGCQPLCGRDREGFASLRRPASPEEHSPAQATSTAGPRLSASPPNPASPNSAPKTGQHRPAHKNPLPKPGRVPRPESGWVHWATPQQSRKQSILLLCPLPPCIQWGLGRDDG